MKIDNTKLRKEQRKIIVRPTTTSAVFMLLFILIVILLISYVSADKRLCLTYGQTVPNEENPRYTCWSDMCQICVTDNNYPTHPGKCKYIEGCESFGEYEPDLDPPELTVNSPINNEVYDSRRVLFDLSSNEPATFSYSRDNGESWRRMVSNSDYYKMELDFADGLNEVIIKARDRNGNEVVVDREFKVDSRKPSISVTYPRGGFVNSIFTVEYTEENVEEIKLHYGNEEPGYEDVLLEGCENGIRQQCMIDISLTKYDGQEIEYWFELKDIAGSVVESRKTKVFVDESDPVITNKENVIEKIEGRYVYFDIKIEEAFLEEVGYTYVDERGRERSRRLCSRLVDGVCKSKVSFSDGDHDILIYVKDKAGGSDSVEKSFFTDSRKPRISRTEPRTGFTNGEFSVNFIEKNPEELLLYYGKIVNGELVLAEPFEVDLEKDCNEGSRSTSCLIDVDLKYYKGDEIKYWFELTDKVGQKTESRPAIVEVDDDPPVLLNDFPLVENNIICKTPGSFCSQGDGVYQRYIDFNLEIDEENFEEIIYSYNYGGRIRESTLCSRLIEGRCKKRVGFSLGNNVVNLQITDKAGNSIGRAIEFDV